MKKTINNLIYGQAGGVTAVINASAYSVIKTEQRYNSINNIYAMQNGIHGIIHENLIDISTKSLKILNKKLLLKVN